MSIVEITKNEDLKVYEWLLERAKGGDVLSRHNIGMTEGVNGNPVAAMRHLRLSASGGDRSSIETLITGFEAGMIHHGDLAETLQAMYRARAETTSGDRDKFIAYLKSNGQYEKEYDV